MINELEMHGAITCTEDTSIVEAAKLLREYKIRHIYVVDAEKRPTGVLSAIDINNKLVAEGRDISKARAIDVMNSPVEAVDVGQECEFAMKIMMEHRTYSCPVTEDGQLKGVVDYRSVAEKIAKKLEE